MCDVTTGLFLKLPVVAIHRQNRWLKWGPHKITCIVHIIKKITE